MVYFIRIHSEIGTLYTLTFYHKLRYGLMFLDRSLFSKNNPIAIFVCFILSQSKSSSKWKCRVIIC